MLKAITKNIEIDGKVQYGHNVNVTYFAQDQAEQLDKSKTILETVDDIAIGDVRKDLRSILGTFLFSGEDVDKKVSVLSGGERTRLALCQLLLSPSNFLILDEPTNHLDIQSKQVLKKALDNYEGAFIIVSHDREFVDGLTNRIWDIENKSLKIHHFSLNEYLSYKMKDKTLSGNTLKNTEKSPVKPKEKTENTIILKPSKQDKEIQRIENDISKLEKEVQSLETELANMDYTASDYQNQLSQYDEKKRNLDNLMSKWEKLMSS